MTECIKTADIAGFSIPSRHITADTIWYIIPLFPHNPSLTPSPRHQLTLWFMWTLSTMFTYLPNQHSSNAKSHFVKSPSLLTSLLQHCFKHYFPSIIVVEKKTRETTSFASPLAWCFSLETCESMYRFVGGTSVSGRSLSEARR